MGDGSIKCCQRGDIPRPKPRCVIATPRKMFILCLHCYLWPLSLTYCGPLPPSGCVTLIILPLALYVIQNSFCKWQAMNNRYNLFSQLRWVYDVDADIDCVTFTLQLGAIGRSISSITGGNYGSIQFKYQNC